MIFRRNKPTTPSDSKTPVLRGRDGPENGNNPLARRFHPDDEPDTIDLHQPAGFTEEPGTADLATGKPMESSAESQLSLVTVSPDTGKFYVLPGPDGEVTYLADDPVTSPTELRPGDRIRLGKMELRLLRQGEE